MEILLVGLSHKTAPVGIREKISFSGENMRQGIRALLECQDVQEGFIVSTCNRVEICTVVSRKDPAAAKRGIARFLADYHKVGLDELEPHLYFMSGEESVQHIFRVSSSLDSMMVGEPQILGQIKEAYNIAYHEGATGNILNRLFHKAFSVAKRVRTETRIATSAVSISFAAVELAKKIFGELEGRTVMLIGAGEMAELAARHLVTSGVGRVIVVNRTFEKAALLASTFSGEAVPFEELEERLGSADIVISSTGAPGVVIDRKMVQRTLKRRKHRPMFFIDIAVPRDIDPAVNSLENVYSYDIDDLEGVVQANIRARAQEAAKAEEIIAGELRQFMEWSRSREAFPTIVKLRSWAEEVRRKEVEKTLKKMEGVSAVDARRIEAMTESILNKILHPPVSRLKKSAHQDEKEDLSEMVRKLFDLDD